jgi:dTDP-4-amino-4,6-dideoxygalactose transaminase
MSAMDNDNEAAAATPLEQMNALEENIARRGNNAYYYAHGHRNDAPA